MHAARRAARDAACGLLQNYIDNHLWDEDLHPEWTGADRERVQIACVDLRRFLNGESSRKRRPRATPAGTVPLPLDPTEELRDRIDGLSRPRK